jgi:hypothetical protein
MYFKTTACIILSGIIISCGSSKEDKKEEQIRVDVTEESEAVPDSMQNSVRGNVSFNQIPTTPNSVILTGLLNHRLVTVYKSRVEATNSGIGSRLSKVYTDYDESDNETEEHYMPGIDILYGFNLLNIAHYDLATQKLNYFFKKPAFIKTLYYPSFEQDSLDKKPINRNYYLVSVYDEDTNKDTMLNKKDLRHFYCFDSASVVKTLLIPADYSVIRSQYDSHNDVMYIYASQDTDKNGMRDKKEPIHIFWIDLKKPAKALRLY